MLVYNTHFGQSGAGSNGNEWKLHICQSSKTQASPLDVFSIISRRLIVVGGSYSSAKTKSVYSTGQADRVEISLQECKS